MSCLIVTGHPSSGKTTLAELLKQRALQHPAIDSVILLNEELVRPDCTKAQCYESPGAEKVTRAALKAAFDRAAKTPKVLVILDSLNYIKGFRYELHCLSKAAGERHGVLWVVNTVPNVEAWNTKSQAYPAELLKELIQRYEPPDARNRWDKPLYTVDVSGGGDASSKSAASSEALSQSVYNMHALGETMMGGGETATAPVQQKKKPTKSAFSRTKKPAVVVSSSTTQQATTMTTLTTSTSTTSTSPAAPTPTKTTTTKDKKQQQQQRHQQQQQPTQGKTLEEQLDDILDSFLLNVQPLKEGNSTRQHIAGNANVLQELDSTTQRLVSAITSAQTVHTGGTLQVPSSTGGITYPMECKRPVALPELRRLRKQYLQWLAIHPPEDSTEKGIATLFIKYIEEQL